MVVARCCWCSRTQNTNDDYYDYSYNRVWPTNESLAERIDKEMHLLSHCFASKMWALQSRGLVSASRAISKLQPPCLTLSRMVWIWTWLWRVGFGR